MVCAPTHHPAWGVLFLFNAFCDRIDLFRETPQAATLHLASIQISRASHILPGSADEDDPASRPKVPASAGTGIICRM